jgi:hypothetical protein
MNFLCCQPPLLSLLCLSLAYILISPFTYLEIPFLISWCECSSTLPLVGGKLNFPLLLTLPLPPQRPPPLQFMLHALLRRHYKVRYIV